MNVNKTRTLCLHKRLHIQIIIKCLHKRLHSYIKRTKGEHNSPLVFTFIF